MKKSQLSVIISSFLFSPLASAALVTSVTANQNRPAVVMSDDVLNSNDDSNAVYANGQNSTVAQLIRCFTPEPPKNLFRILCKCLFSEVTVQAVTELDNKAAHCHTPVPQWPFHGLLFSVSSANIIGSRSCNLSCSPKPY